MKILVVENEPSESKLVNHVLNASGHNVNSVDAAELVFAAIRTDRPQIILLDMDLPGMDGLTFVRKLKADQETRDIPVVAITTYPEKFSRSDALQAGCDAYLRKPVSTRRLPEQLRDVLAKGGGK